MEVDFRGFSTDLGCCLSRIRLVMDVGPGLIQGYTDAGAPKADPERSVAQVSLETAGLPPRSGTLLCVPLNATMDTRRVLSAPDWVANDLPLTYQFGYMYYLGFGPGALSCVLSEL